MNTLMTNNIQPKQNINKLRRKRLADDIEKEAEANSEESLIIEDYEGECERCALDYQPKVCSMC